MPRAADVAQRNKQKDEFWIEVTMGSKFTDEIGENKTSWIKLKFKSNFMKVKV